MADKIPLAEQLDEVRAEYTRRCQAYPLLVIRGQMREEAAEFKIARMAAAHNTLAWLFKHADEIKEWVELATKFGGKGVRADMAMDAPVDVLPAELQWEEPESGEAKEETRPDEGEAGGGAGVSADAE